VMYDHRLGWKTWAAGIGGTVGLALVARVLVRPRVEGRLHVVGPDGLVEASPEGLANAAGVDLATYALASAMQSEERTDRGRLAVGSAVWNAVRGRHDSVFAKLCPTGRLGSQAANGYADTKRPPTARTLQLAAAVLEGRVPDMVRGATQWDAPKTQDRLHALYLQDPVKYPKYRYGSAEIAARRIAAGAHEVRVPGVPDTRFWSYA
jgi:hypothetical protein